MPVALQNWWWLDADVIALCKSLTRLEGNGSCICTMHYWYLDRLCWMKNGFNFNHAFISTPSFGESFYVDCYFFSGFKAAHLTKYLIVDILWTWCLESNGFSGSTQFSLTHQAIFTRLIWKLASLLHAAWTTKTQQCNILHGLMYEDEILYIGNGISNFCDR